MNVTRIWTRGRPHSNEFVMEYTISYGTNGLDYADYKEPSGNAMVRYSLSTYFLVINHVNLLVIVLLSFISN